MKDSKHCFRCGLDFSPPMMAFHLKHEHLTLKCGLCRSIIPRLGFTRSGLIRAQFCSRTCMNEAELRGLCKRCSKEPSGSFERGTCRPCRRDLWHRERTLHSIRQELLGMEESRVLPLPYQRRNRATG
jgi:hypothetical protein